MAADRWHHLALGDQLLCQWLSYAAHHGGGHDPDAHQPHLADRYLARYSGVDHLLSKTYLSRAQIPKRLLLTFLTGSLATTIILLGQTAPAVQEADGQFVVTLRLIGAAS